MKEKPFHLGMPFGEALARLARVPKEKGARKHRAPKTSPQRGRKRKKDGG
jgi:hypothetical protein